MEQKCLARIFERPIAISCGTSAIDIHRKSSTGRREGTMGGKGGEGRKMAAGLRRTTGTGGRGEDCGRREPALPSAFSPALLLLLLVASACLGQVSAVDVHTPAELSVENGTEAQLPCTFTTSETISSAASVTWHFQAEGSATSVSFFYYSNGRAYPGQSTRFKGRISWAGDLNKKDASIRIANVQFQDHGTYVCDVKNPPDIVVTPGEIRVRVVERVEGDGHRRKGQEEEEEEDETAGLPPQGDPPGNGDNPGDLPGPSGEKATTIRVPPAEDPAAPGTLAQLTEGMGRLENLLAAILEQLERSLPAVAPLPRFWTAVLERLERLERCRESTERHGQ